MPPFSRRKRTLALLPLLAAGTMVGTLPLSAQSESPLPDSRERALQAVERQGPIVIDGHLDEPEWSRAPAATGFVQVEPDEGELAMEQTEVRILYDQSDIYIGARLFDSDTARVARQLTRRGVTGRAAGYFEFSFDPDFDRTTGYTFRVTAAGVQRDQYNFDDTRSDGSWDGVWESAVRMHEDGWTVEVRIPLSQLRYNPSTQPQEWGVNFARRRIADNERSEWAWVPRGTPGTVSRWGQLHGLVLQERSRHVELLPYVMGGLERAEPTSGDPFFDGSDPRGQVGLDARAGLGANFRLDMTFNPDFGQVQVDPRVVNLTAYETFFPEHRPFFTRDDRALDFDLGGRREALFYSRRIGRSPQGSTPAGAAFTATPGEASILGAGKVTGRTSGGLSVGVLAALTAEETGRAYFQEEDRFERYVAEPRTQFGLVRLRQDLRDAQTRVGGIVTAVNRELGGSESIRARLPVRAFTGGLDFEHTWADREWLLEGQVAGSYVEGEADAIARIQRSPNHYFQRPDQDHVSFEPTRTSLSGAEWRVRLSREGGRHWDGDMWLRQRTPGFEVNDFGFSTNRESFNAGARIGYRQPDPGEIFRSWSVNLSSNHSWRNSVLDDAFSASAWSEAHRSGSVRLSSRFTFLNWWGTSLDLDYDPETLSDGLTRGGPLMVQPGLRGVGFSMNTDRRDDVTYGVSANYEDGLAGGHRWSTSFNIEARPTARLRVEFSPRYLRQSSVDQYVSTIPTFDGDLVFEPTYGDRYLFADIRREEVSFETQFDIIFSPTLSLQVFAQPLVSAADYQAYKQLAEAGTFDFLRFSEGTAVDAGGQTACSGGSLCRSDGRVYVDLLGDGTPDIDFADRTFNVRSLRGSAVLRWEYRPGSRIYLVWQQQRSERGLLGDLELSRDVGALFDASPENVFMIKMDYWFTP